MESLNQKEQQLSLRRPVAEETQRELEEKHAKYEELRKKVSGLKDEEANLTKSIERSLRATRRLQKTTAEQKNELQTKRDAALEQLRDHTEVLKLLERDIYEVDRKLELVNAENGRLKLCNARIKADISTMNSEAEKHKSTTIKILQDLAILRELLLKAWSEDSYIQKEFVETEQEILRAMANLIAKVQHREQKVDSISNRLQSNLDGLDSLLGSQSVVNP
ncbi:uncharacterized protein LOC132248445 [Alligator mississippiensis]|uniref:uncharacterized protein LOC132248445 n=1 Tax=Alligator mississippiensis TaxID=8496 RepID=UPI0028779FC8|nr:uncharacterized protein LOC132248445 [Alligator mississippiensis]